MRGSGVSGCWMWREFGMRGRARIRGGVDWSRLSGLNEMREGGVRLSGW
jgi:hypothetical protein